MTLNYFSQGSQSGDLCDTNGKPLKSHEGRFAGNQLLPTLTQVSRVESDQKISMRISTKACFGSIRAAKELLPRRFLRNYASAQQKLDNPDQPRKPFNSIQAVQFHTGSQIGS